MLRPNFLIIQEHGKSTYDTFYKVDVQFKNCIPRASQEQFTIPTFIIILSMKLYYKI